MELMTSKIEILFNNEFRKPVIKQLAYELNRNFYNEHIVIYCKEKIYIKDENLLYAVESYQRSRAKSIHHSVFKYKEGILLILSYKKISAKAISIDLKNIFTTLNILISNFYIGKSCLAYDLTNLDRSIKESIYTSLTCELINEDIKKYNEIGIYKLLMPYSNGTWLKSFTTDILNPIKNYDSGNLIETARKYISCGGNIKETAEIMYQHKNTIRYRINIMKDLLSIESNGDFYEQLSIAIKYEKLL
jgi:sugar diacid utilization regulator